MLKETMKKRESVNDAKVIKNKSNDIILYQIKIDIINKYHRHSESFRYRFLFNFAIRD